MMDAEKCHAFHPHCHTSPLPLPFRHTQKCVQTLSHRGTLHADPRGLTYARKYARSHGQTAMADPKVRDLVECNETLARAKKRHDFEIVFRGGVLDWDSAEVLMSADSGHANVSDVVMEVDDEGEDKEEIDEDDGEEDGMRRRNNQREEGEEEAK